MLLFCNRNSYSIKHYKVCDADLQKPYFSGENLDKDESGSFLCEVFSKTENGSCNFVSVEEKIMDILIFVI